jgi:hypothetical protein
MTEPQGAATVCFEDDVPQALAPKQAEGLHLR